jgi:hypothetical protein
MTFHLTDEQQCVLQLIADGPLRALPEIERHTGRLAAANLIVLADNTRWTIIKLGEAMLERQYCSLH